MLLVRHFFYERIGKTRIHFVVVFPVRRAKDGTCMCHVTEWPQTLVGKAVVISLFFFLAEPNAAQCVSRIVRRHLQPVVAVYGFRVGIAASLGHPCPVAGAKYRLNGCNQAAGWNRYGDNSALSVVNVGFAIGDYKQATT